MTRPVLERNTHPRSPRSGAVQAGTWQGEPSGSSQSAQSELSRANPQSQLDDVDAEAVEDVVVQDGQLLHDVVDPDGLGARPRCAQPRVGHGGYARRPVPAQVEGHHVGLHMVQCRHYPVAEFMAQKPSPADDIGASGPRSGYSSQGARRAEQADRP